ncbi:MAG: pdaA [Clostridiales bacterium]|jgi:peptidoglycan-N-acetylmuramic acid deacetylase|nr:pdaA [Clostridiales bacterium]
MLTFKKLPLLISIILSFVLIFSSCLNKKLPSQSMPDNTTSVDQSTKDNNPISSPNNFDENQKTNEDKEEVNSPVITPENTVLDNTLIPWGLKLNNTHTVPEIPAKIKAMFDKYSGYYVGDSTSKVIYMTFDEGYENGYTSQILDTLKTNNVKAAFFVTKPYITGNKDLIKRMVNEGHLVGNHTSNHPSMPSKTGDIAAFNLEFSDTEKAFREVTGVEMPKFFRPPMGEFSEKSLYLTQRLGYRSIFWSFAHKDWEVNNQPKVDETINKIMTRSHNGEIMLLHAVSKSNTIALDSIIKEMQSIGYRFADLRELK